MMRVLVICGAVVVALVATAWVVGWFLPVQHRVVRSLVVPNTADAVYAVIADVAQYPHWRTGVDSVRPLERGADGRERYCEYGAHGAIVYDVVVSRPPRVRVTRISGHDLPFGGQWTYDVTPSGSGARLRITEDGSVYNPMFRFVSRFVVGHARTIEQYLKDLATTLGADARIRAEPSGS